MRRIHNQIQSGIFRFVDFFYPLFKGFLPLQTYRYAACGGSNTLLGLVIFSFSYNFIFHKSIVHLGFLALQPYVAALFASFLVTFPIGFYLSLYVVFHGSHLKKRIQLFRYFLVVIFCMLLNYGFLKLFVGMLGWFPTPSQILTTVIVVCFSYLSQRHFSFKGHKSPARKHRVKAYGEA